MNYTIEKKGEKSNKKKDLIIDPFLNFKYIPILSGPTPKHQ